MIFEKIPETKYHSRVIKFIWVKPVFLGEVAEEDMPAFIIDLALKIVCDKKGETIPEDDLSIEDIQAISNYLMSRFNKKKTDAD